MHTVRILICHCLPLDFVFVFVWETTSTTLGSRNRSHLWSRMPPFCVDKITNRRRIRCFQNSLLNDKYAFIATLCIYRRSCPSATLQHQRRRLATRPIASLGRNIVIRTSSVVFNILQLFDKRFHRTIALHWNFSIFLLTIDNVATLCRRSDRPTLVEARLEDHENDQIVSRSITVNRSR